MTRRLFVPMLLVVLTPAGLRASPVPSPHWLRIPGTGDGPTSCVFKRVVQIDQQPHEATLGVFTDFSRCGVRVDGELVGEFDGILGEPVVRLGSRLTAGEHVLLVEAHSSAGPGAVAVELRLGSEAGVDRFIVSDANWHVATAPDRWQAATTTGAIARESWGHRPPKPTVDALDDYNQWEEARGAADANDDARFSLVDGFSIERLRSARPDEGSWLGVTFDSKGRLLIAREDHGLLRFSLDDLDASPEHLADSLKQVRGLAWRGDTLFANAEGLRGLYRLQDTDNDDRFDVVEQVMMTPGSSGDHGRNDLTVGPDGLVYSIHGESVKMVDSLQTAVPATYEFGERAHPIGGHLVRSDGASGWHVVAAGLRNPFGIAFNRDGEAFTFDADAEADQGLPWYRPTRITHIVSGADYGWRPGDGKWPEYAADSLPATLDVGKASPTAMAFGYRSNFPPPYREALFALDWAYGRILAVHLHSQGGSYRARAETFLRGRPLNVTDLTFSSDGALYFVTGGRKTRSSLYRVRYVRPRSTADRTTDTTDTTELTLQQVHREHYSASVRTLRRQLETLHLGGVADAVDRVWPRLSDDDRWIRHAARVALEHQDTATWKDRALKGENAGRAATALLALARVGPAEALDDVLRRLKTWSFSELNTWQKLAAVRAASISARRQQTKAPKNSGAIVELLAAHFPTGTRSIDRELCALLAEHGDEAIPPRTLPLIARSRDQRDRLLYLSVLAGVRDGWTPALRREYFVALKGAQFFQGDRRLAGLVREIETRALAAVPEKDRDRYERIVERSAPSETPVETRPLVKKWTTADLEPNLGEPSSGRDLERGKRTFGRASCSRCHRFGALGRPYGPDLTAVASRFGSSDLLAAIVSPSQIVPEQYRSRVITLRDGTVLTGQVVRNEFRDAVVHVATDPTNLDQVRTVKKGDILAHESLPTSPMPAGLLDTFTRGEILDLLAFLRSGSGRG